MKTLFDQITAGVTIFPECPFIGKIGVKNIEFRDDKFFTVDQAGLYKSTVAISDESVEMLEINVVTSTSVQEKRGQ